MSSRPLVMVGSGGHAQVLLDLIERLGLNVLGYCGPAPSERENFQNIEFLGSDEQFKNKFSPNEVTLVNGMGMMPRSLARKVIFEQFKPEYKFASLVHPAAIISPKVVLGEGVQVMAGAVLQAGARVGDNSIINTKASVDHDCHLFAHTHIAVGATLSGGVMVGNGVFVGAGATIIQDIKIGAGAIVGAGVTVVKDVADNALIK